MAEMDDFITDAPDLYDCCEHCEHFGGDEDWPDNHKRPCPYGCND